jgi:hypothetical protein
VLHPARDTPFDAAPKPVFVTFPPIAGYGLQPVLIHLGAHGRHLEDLVTLRCSCHLDMSAALSYRLGLAVHHAVDFTFVKHGAGMALVPGLGAALAITGPALRPVHPAWAV